MRPHSENWCTKSLERDNIDILYLWMLEENNKLSIKFKYVLKLKYRVHAQKNYVNLHLKKSLKRDKIYNMYLWIMEEHSSLKRASPIFA